MFTSQKNYSNTFHLSIEKLQRQAKSAAMKS